MSNTIARTARVLLADDHPELLAQTGAVLADDFDIVGSVADGVELIRAALDLKPDVVVLDITMPRMDGIEAAWRLLHLDCHAKFVFLSIHEDPDYVSAALRAGGTAYVVKSRMASDLIEAIHEALAERRFVS
ncbi:MAG: hypothetical protein RL030_1536, partial [Pseudomonadota bacterium]